MAWQYKDADRPIEERLDDLLARMTLDEKLAQLRATSPPEGAAGEAALANGIAAIVGLAGSSGISPAAYRQHTTGLQQQLQEGTRLGIPALICERLPQALKVVGMNWVPPALAQAATFDPELTHALAATERELLRGVGVTQLLGPVLDVVRDPRVSGLLETYGEDPYLAGRMGVATVRGLQGDSLVDGVLAAAGHFLGAALVEGGRRHAAVEIGRRQLREVVAEPFAAVIREARLRCVVCADSAIDGLACSGATEVLTDLLRGDLGFRGLVCADQGAVEQLVTEQRVAADRRAAAALAVTAGVDVELPGGECFGLPLEDALDRRLLEEEAIDLAVRRVLQQKFELGLFDLPAPVEMRAAAEATPEQLALLRRVGEQSVVLLKNDDVLPLAEGARIALFGVGSPAATGSGTAAAQEDPDRSAGDPRQVPADELKRLLAERFRVRESRLDGRASPSGSDAAARALGDADIAVVWFSDAAADQSVELSPALQNLFAEASGRKIPIVLVAQDRSIFAAAPLLDQAAAVLVNWCPARYSAGAVADILSGVLNPSGRLPVSVPRHITALPAHYNQRTGSSAGMDNVLYGFGHGLSYSTFSYSDPKCVGTVDSHGAVDVSVTIENMSAVAGAEVVQLYMHDPVADVVRPRRQLVGFRRVELNPGQRATVVFHVDVSLFAYYNRALEYVVDPGQIELMVGASSADIRGRCQLTVEGERRQFKQQQRLATQSQIQYPDG